MADGKPNQLVGWRLTELERDVRENRQRQDDAIEHNRQQIEELRKSSERGLATAFRRIDAIVLKVSFLSSLVGAAGYAILEWLVQKASK